MAPFPPLSLCLSKWLSPTFKKSKLLILVWSLVTMYTVCVEIPRHHCTDNIAYPLAFKIMTSHITLQQCSLERMWFLTEKRSEVMVWKFKNDGHDIMICRSFHPDLFSDIHYCLEKLMDSYKMYNVKKEGNASLKIERIWFLHNFFVSINMHI